MIIQKIKKECERIEEDAIHSSKGHYNASVYWSKIHYSVGVLMITLSAGAGLDIFAINAEYAGYLTLFVVILASLQTFIRADDKSVKHKNSADELNYLKNKARRLREVKTENFTEKKLIKELDALADKYGEITMLSPTISKSAFQKAKKGIDESQANYITDK